MADVEQIQKCVTSWMQTGRDMMLAGIKNGFSVGTKTSPHDLVTNVDKQVEKFYVTSIKKEFPDSHFVGEEGAKAKDIGQFPGLFWIIDPIDGTMNYVKQHDNFASMIAVYEHGKPVLGFIMDVMRNDIYWGGPKTGVYVNERPLKAPEDLSLSDGLLAIGGRMLLAGKYHAQELAAKSFGLRINGSSGMEFIGVLKGQLIGYFSYLHPWDFAAGRIMAESLGLIVKRIDGRAPNMLLSTTVLVATKRAGKEIIQVANS